MLDYVAIEDVGRAINPHIVHGQAIGALAQGLGGVFLDEIIYDADGQILNTSLAEYLLPTASDFPNLRAITMELRRSKTNPLGAKGAGEGGMVAVAATAANAVAAALEPLGVEIRDLPLSPARVWRLINKSRVTWHEITAFPSVRPRASEDPITHHACHPGFPHARERRRSMRCRVRLCAVMMRK